MMDIFAPLATQNGPKVTTPGVDGLDGVCFWKCCLLPRPFALVSCWRFVSNSRTQTHTSLFSRLLVLLVAPSNRSEDSVVSEVVIDTSFIFCFISARTTAPTARSNPDSNVKVAAKWYGRVYRRSKLHLGCVLWAWQQRNTSARARLVTASACCAHVWCVGRFTPFLVSPNTFPTRNRGNAIALFFLGVEQYGGHDIR